MNFFAALKLLQIKIANPESLWSIRDRESGPRLNPSGDKLWRAGLPSEVGGLQSFFFTQRDNISRLKTQRELAKKSLPSEACEQTDSLLQCG